jgi:hypothetical protein
MEQWKNHQCNPLLILGCVQYLFVMFQFNQKRWIVLIKRQQKLEEMINSLNDDENPIIILQTKKRKS